MAQSWKSLLFETLELGVSSAVAPELLPQNQVAWGMNIDVRGGKPATRPNLRNLGNLPTGLIQGCEYFGVQNGMLVASINGVMYRLRIGINSIIVEEIPLTFRNSAIIKQVWMTQTVETLVIQDGQSNPIMYNGSVANRAVTGQVPRGRQMAYGNGRLWVAVNANEIVAGDIRTSAEGSELNFTEATYLTGGGKLFFGSPITGMAFIPVTGQADYGALLVYGARETNAIRADITTRDDWGKVPGFVTAILRSVGAAAQWSIVSVNQDLYWRDSNGGIRSIRNALADEAGPGSAPISREVSRLTDYDSQQLLSFCSGVYFNNRLLLTSSPFLLPNGGVAWKNLISLDFAPLSTMGSKSQPAYNGKWNGLNFVKLVGGEFNGKNRAFALTTDDDGNNQLWEFESGSRADQPVQCTDGTADPLTFEYPISSFVEYPLRNFGEAKRRKRLDRCDVWLTSVDGDVDLKVYWRSDNSVKWNVWDEASTCAQTTDPSEVAPHVWKNLVSQERPQFKTFTIPDSVNEVAKYANQVGFEFQIRLAWEGRCRIHRVMLHGELLDDPDYADRSGFEVECVEQDVTGNQITYAVPTDGCPAFVVRFGNNIVRRRTVVHLGPSGPTVFTFCNTSPAPITGFHVNVIPFCAGQFVLTTPPPSTVGIGECVEFTVTSVPTPGCPNPTGIVKLDDDGVPFFDFPVDDESGASAPSITVEPESMCVEDADPASFAVTATGTAPLEYDWFESTDGGENWTEIVDGGIYSGANTSTLTIDPAGVGMDDYRYYCRVRNTHGSVDSDEVTLAVGNCNVNCALTLPLAFSGEVQYATLVEAQDVLLYNAFDCFAAGFTSGFGPGVANPIDISVVKPIADGGTTILTCASTATAGEFIIAYLHAAFQGPGTITIDFTNTSALPECTVELLDPVTRDVIDDDGLSAASGTLTLSVPSAGVYFIRTRSRDMVTSGSTAEYTMVFSGGNYVLNPVVAVWDDSGTARNLEACPKLLIPPLFGGIGDIYPSCGDADGGIFNQVSGCVGFVDNLPVDSFSASDGGDSLTLAGVDTTMSGGGDPRLVMYGSVNGEVGEQLFFAYSISSSISPVGSSIVARIYAEDGTLVQEKTASEPTGNSGGTLTFDPLPYTGRYTVYVDLGSNDPCTATVSVTITSSGEMTVNPVQALYDAGVDCPARLNCGDHCIL